MRAVIFDTEVNGLEAKEVVELAYCQADLIDGKFTRGNIFSDRYKPSKPFEAGAVAIHHIIAEDVEKSDPSSEAKIPDCEVIIAHNVDFDAEVVNNTTAKRICTLALCRHLWPQFKSHSLSCVFLELRGISFSTVSIIEEAHSAGTDVFILTRVLETIIEQTEVKSMDQLYELSEKARIPEHMPFGKHKGEPIADIPTSYVQWLLKQTDVDPYLRKALSGRI